MPVATTSASYGTLTATRGAFVCPAHCGMGEYPSGAAEPAGGAPGCCAGGRGMDFVVCACTVHASARTIRAAVAFAIAGVYKSRGAGRHGEIVETPQISRELWGPFLSRIRSQMSRRSWRRALLTQRWVSATTK